MNDQSKMVAGAAVGALIGCTVSYLFFTDGGKVIRERLEPTVDDLTREFTKFRRTIEKVGTVANDGLRAYQEFQQARGQTTFPTGTSH